jgi:hypothetical protein
MPSETLHEAATCSSPLAETPEDDRGAPGEDRRADWHVEPRRFELLTSCLQSRRSTN